MFGGTNSLHSYCKDLQNLITSTEEHIITPLRKELHKISEDSDILLLEIRDAEVIKSFYIVYLQNKTFEYISQQIAAICSADEESANAVLKEYPKSELCFQCLGIDEDTIQVGNEHTLV